MSSEQPQHRRVRKLTWALLFSGGLNILLMGGFGYWVLKERPPTPYYALKPLEKSPEQPLAMEQSNSEVIGAFRTLPFEQLISKLSNTQLIENGYTQRDVALASLVSYYHFDLARALANLPQPLQKRVLLYGTDKITFYPGLTAEQFQAVIDFSSTEKWPLTTQGLFLELRKQPLPFEPSLVDAFVLSPQYLAVELLFNRSDVPIDKLELLAILRDGDWIMLSNFAEKQKVSQDLSPSRRQRFLLEYVKRKSKAAAYVLLKTDGDFAAKKLDDQTILQMLDLLSTRTPSAEKFAVALLSNPRSDAVWNSASLRLYEYVGEPIADRKDPQAILARFVPQTKWNAAPKKPAPAIVKPVAEASKPSAKTLPLPKVASTSVKPAPVLKKEKTYIVQEGDSYWKISKKLKVDLNTLKAYNNVENDFLKPGTSLKIP